ncbi:conserved protein of unknown function [Agreia sp. COWG]|nr:conserved protein of unknown function [Agreia sp. COWG]
MTSRFHDLENLVRQNGNVASRARLEGRGIAPAHIDAVRRFGALTALRRGIYAVPEADVDQRRAVALGGRLGCISALRRAGIWGGMDSALHVHVPETSSRLHLAEVIPFGRDPSVARTDKTFWAEPGQPRVHWQKPTRALPGWGSEWLVDPLEALRQAALCLDDEHAIAAIDSAFHRRVLQSGHLDCLFARLPERLSRLRGELDFAADSGPESVVRVRMRRAGFTVEPQMAIPGSSDLDLLINGVVGLDIDSLSWHSGAKQVSYDYSKTLQSFALGLPTLRILPHHIFECWPSTFAAISRLVSDTTELHRLRSRFRRLG